MWRISGCLRIACVVHRTLNNELDSNRQYQHPHERLDDGECQTHTGGVVWTKGDDEVGFRRFLSPVFTFVVETFHDCIPRPEVQQDGGQWKIQGVVAALGFEPIFIQARSFDRVGYGVQL